MNKRRNHNRCMKILRTDKETIDHSGAPMLESGNIASSVGPVKLKVLVPPNMVFLIPGQKWSLRSQ
jgi:hypothetical protein